MAETLDSIAKRQNARLIDKWLSPNGYYHRTYEFGSRKSAREFMRSVRASSLSLYAPFFCDTFKLARVTVYTND